MYGDGLDPIADAAARRAAERADALSWRGRVRRWTRGFKTGCVAAWTAFAAASAWTWRNTPSAAQATFVFVAWCIALGFLCVATAWELNNAGQGWALIFQSWGAFAWAGGVSIAGLSIWSHRQHKEAMREAEAFGDDGKPKDARKARGRAAKWMTSTIICAAITLFGVFSNLVSHASMDADHAIEVEEDREAVRQTIRRMNREMAAMAKPVGVEYDRETLEAYVSEGIGWGLPNLDATRPADAGADYPGPACRADLTRPRQRDLCNLAATVRADLADAAEMQAALNAKAAEIAAEEAKLEALQPIAGAKHYQRMAELWNSFPGAPQTTPGVIQTWGVFFLAVGTLLVLMMGWDSVGETWQNRNRTPLAHPPSTSGA